MLQAASPHAALPGNFNRLMAEQNTTPVNPGSNCELICPRWSIVNSRPEEFLWGKTFFAIIKPTPVKGV